MSNVIKAELVKELRERTNVSMMECKRALEKTNGDISAAIDLLRKSGEAAAVKKQTRIAAEGIVIINQNSKLNKASIVEVNCETDFVAKNHKLYEFTTKISEVVLNTNITNLSELVLQQFSPDATIEQERLSLVSQLGENIVLRKVELISSESNQFLGIYQHGSPAKIACAVCLEGGSIDLAKDLAMHITAMRPEYMTKADLPKERYQKELLIFTEQTKNANNGKPEDILQKIIIGKVNKFFKEITLLDQIYIKDQDLTVEKLLAKNNAKVIQFCRIEVGKE